ncbi:hypothetical protein ACFLXQ_08235, partial [Chloroflexota bacterium]
EITEGELPHNAVDAYTCQFETDDFLIVNKVIRFISDAEARKYKDGIANFFILDRGYQKLDLQAGIAPDSARAVYAEDPQGAIIIASFSQEEYLVEYGYVEQTVDPQDRAMTISLLLQLSANKMFSLNIGDRLLLLIKQGAEKYEIKVLKAFVVEDGVISFNAQTEEQTQDDLLLVRYLSRGKDASDVELISYEFRVLSQLSLLAVKSQGLSVSGINIDIYDREMKRVGTVSMDVDAIEAFQAKEITAAELKESWSVLPDPDYRGTLRYALP